MTPLRRALLYSAACAALLGVFALYTRPEFVIGVANQIWACF
jgi:hypothetical protein